jgi:hypothetical protein
VNQLGECKWKASTNWNSSTCMQLQVRGVGCTGGGRDWRMAPATDTHGS